MQSVFHAHRWCVAVFVMGLQSSCIQIDDGDHDNEIISRVELTFTPENGGTPLVFAFEDPDGDGGMSGEADRIELSADTVYVLTIRFENGLADPPEDLTEEIEAEAEQHFVFVISDVGTVAYADVESDYGMNLVGDDLPVGLRNSFTTQSATTGELRIMLRHLPELNGEPQKSSELPAMLAAGEDLPGAVDVDVTFELVVS